MNEPLPERGGRKAPKSWCLAVLSAFMLTACSARTTTTAPEPTTTWDARPPSQWDSAVIFRFYDTLPGMPERRNAWTPSVRVSDGARSWTVGADKVAEINSPSPRSPWFRIDGVDSLYLEIRLELAGGTAERTQASMVVPVRRNEALSVALYVGNSGLLRTPSIGEAGIELFPLQGLPTTAEDSLGVSWAYSPMGPLYYIP